MTHGTRCGFWPAHVAWCNGHRTHTVPRWLSVAH